MLGNFSVGEMSLCTFITPLAYPSRLNNRYLPVRCIQNFLIAFMFVEIPGLIYSHCLGSFVAELTCVDLLLFVHVYKL